MERLGDVVVRTGFEAFFPIVDHRLGRERDDRELGKLGLLADLPSRLQAIHHRHHDVHQHEIDTGVLAQVLERLTPVAGDLDLGALGLE